LSETEDEGGCWAVYSFDAGPAIIEAVFSSELLAYRFAESWMRVDWLPWGAKAAEVLR